MSHPDAVRRWVILRACPLYSRPPPSKGYMVTLREGVDNMGGGVAYMGGSLYKHRVVSVYGSGRLTTARVRATSGLRMFRTRQRRGRRSIGVLYAIIQTWRGVTYGEAFDMAAGDSLSPAVSYRHDSDA
eukprot:9355532-Pyramimonas_sp.AAC.1